MSRDLGSLLRPAVVWLAVTGAASSAVSTVPSAWSSARSSAGPDAVLDLVVATCAIGLAVALSWLWLVTTSTVVGLLRGRVPTRGATRRLVLLACGVAIAAGTSAPAVAAGGDGREVLAGLPLPERAVAPLGHRSGPHEAAPRPAPRSTPAQAAGGTYVVRPGDSLSAIALAHPGPGSLDQRWRAIWRANRDVVGADPDLILPGQTLRLPPTLHATGTNTSQTDTSQTDQDGERP